MNRFKIVIALAALVATQIACAASANVGAAATPAPAPTVAPVPTAQVIIVQVPAPAAQPAPVVAPAQAAEPLDAGEVVFLSILFAGSSISAATLIAYLLLRKPATPRKPLEFYDPAQGSESIPLINVTNHYHYHAGKPPISPSALNMPDNWTINRKAEHLLGMGFTKDEARAYLESQHRAQLPPAR